MVFGLNLIFSFVNNVLLLLLLIVNHFKINFKIRRCLISFQASFKKVLHSNTKQQLKHAL